MKYFIEVLKKYAKFKGRARRKEYWMFILFYLIFAIAAAVLDEILGSQPVISIVYGLVLILPTLAVTVRRLHDTNHRGWWILIVFVVPLIGAIVLLVFTLLDSDVGNNWYGKNPKKETA